MSTVKKTTNKYVREDMEKKEPLYVFGGIVNWFIHYGKQYIGFTKKIDSPYNLAISFKSIYMKETKTLIRKTKCTLVFTAVLTSKKVNEISTKTLHDQTTERQ